MLPSEVYPIYHQEQENERNFMCAGTHCVAKSISVRSASHRLIAELRRLFIFIS